MIFYFSGIIDESIRLDIVKYVNFILIAKNVLVGTINQACQEK